MLEYWPCMGLVCICGWRGFTVHLGSFRLGEAFVATRSLQPFSLGGQFPAVQSYMAPLRDPQPRPHLQELVGFIKGPMREKDTTYC